MTKAEIFLVFAFAFIAATLIAPGDYEEALIHDAIRKDPPQRPAQIVFEPKGALHYMTNPVKPYCTATVNGKCYVSSTDKARYGE